MIALITAAAAVLVTAGVLFLTGVIGGKAPDAPPALQKGELTVGEDIVFERITDLYYTYDASTFPPHYQRYRFYAAEGKHWFFHETREGDHWPLTEEDATVSGTRELTEAQWAGFLSLVSGGTVTKREESADSGGAGPWLYLYWDGDRGEYQVFGFSSREAETSFEELCGELAGTQE